MCFRTKQHQLSVLSVCHVQLTSLSSVRSSVRGASFQMISVPQTLSCASWSPVGVWWRGHFFWVRSCARPLRLLPPLRTAGGLRRAGAQNAQKVTARLQLQVCSTGNVLKRNVATLIPKLDYSSSLGGEPLSFASGVRPTNPVKVKQVSHPVKRRKEGSWVKLLKQINLNHSITLCFNWINNTAAAIGPDNEGGAFRVCPPSLLLFSHSDLLRP